MVRLEEEAWIFSNFHCKPDKKSHNVLCQFANCWTTFQFLLWPFTNTISVMYLSIINEIYPRYLSINSRLLVCYISFGFSDTTFLYFFITVILLLRKPDTLTYAWTNMILYINFVTARFLPVQCNLFHKLGTQCHATPNQISWAAYGEKRAIS